MTRGQVRQFAKALEAAGGELVPVEQNPLDAVWKDRPEPPLASVREQPESLRRQAGRREDRGDRQAHRREARRRRDPHRSGLDRLALQHPRRRHPAHAAARSPTPSSTPTAGPSFSSTAENFRTPSATASNRSPTSARRAISARGSRSSARPSEKSSTTRTARPRRWRGSSRRPAARSWRAPTRSPCRRRRRAPPSSPAARAAHLRDGVAMHALPALHRSRARRLADRDRRGEEAGAAAQRDRRGRRRRRSTTSPSSRSPPPARTRAINHYRVTERTNRTLESGELYLVDSGAQYRDGTTDITRTLLIGEPPPERLDLYRDRFTRVLKGHIAIADRALSERHDRRAARRLRARRALAGRPRFRPRHRPRRRQLSLRARGPAAHLQDRPHARSSPA